MSLEEREAARLKVLSAFYELSGSDVFEHIGPNEIMKATGLDGAQLNLAAQWLVNEGLIETQALDPLWSITHQGIREVEAAKKNPGKSTDHFASSVTQYVFNAPVGAVQTGAQSTASVNQHIGFDHTHVAQLLAAIRSALPPGRAELHETIADLEAEVAAPQPKPSRLRSSLTYLWTGAKDIATVAPFMLDLAKIFGVQIPGM
jgi:hypothetical protein